MNQSIWQKTAQKKKSEPLKKDINVDVLIIGGGLSGTMSAYYLRNSHLNIAVVEKDQMGSHTSGHTTAKITILHDLIYQRLARHYSDEYAYQYYLSNKEALNDIKSIIKNEQIDCDYQENTAFLYTNQQRNVTKLKKEKDLLQSFGEPIIETAEHLYTIGITNQAVFHPLKYLYQIVQICQKHHIQFYENSKATTIIRYHDHYKVNVNGHSVTCRYLVHATRYPFIKKGFYFLKLFQTRECIDLVSSSQGKDSSLSADQTVSYRSIDDDHSLIINRDTHDWFAQDSMPLRGVPYIGQYKNHEYMIYGFQKWGMTLSHVAGKLISDLILENYNPYKPLYYCHYFSISHSRLYLRQILSNTLKGYILQRYQTEELDQLKAKEGAIIKIQHHLYAVYKDENCHFHIFSPYCPHLKCLVHFNRKNQTWDCPCHQSVYDAYGHLLEGPSLSSLTVVNDKNH